MNVLIQPSMLPRNKETRFERRRAASLQKTTMPFGEPTVLVESFDSTVRNKSNRFERRRQASLNKNKTKI